MKEKKNQGIKELIKAGKIDTVVVGFTDHYGRLLGKRFAANFYLKSIEEHGTHACNYLLTTDMEMEPVPGYAYANWELGYGDFHLVPDPDTMRRASWLKKSAMVLCDIVDDKTHKLLDIAPRSVLKKQLDKLAAMGLKANGASELEYYLFEDDYRTAFDNNYQNLKPVGWYLEDYHLMQGARTEAFTAKARKHLQKSGIQVENSKGEWGLGQHELNIEYAEVLEMADRHVVFKQCLKEIADAMGISISFMAKFDQKQAGSSCHIHLSLTRDGKNAFTGKESLGPVKASDYFKWFLGGWIKYVPDVMPFYAPTINSYKRYVDGSWAPTRLAWSYDNRTAGFRVVGKGESLRIECRIPGADCNPYLAFAASLASGLKGIEEKITPPDIFVGDIYAAQHLPRVAYSLEEALNIFENSPFAKDSFGEKVVEHYSHHFKKETEAYKSAVTDWERRRYFERI